MCPSLPSHDSAYRGFAHAKSGSDFILLQRSGEFANSEHAIGIELGVKAALTLGGCAVTLCVCVVLFGSFPSQMVWIDASEMTFAAFVGCLMPLCWRWAIEAFANGAGCNSTFNIASAIFAAGKWPDHAFIPERGCRRDQLGDELVRSISGCSSAKRVAMGPPSVVVGKAPATFSLWLVASVNAAYTGIGHSGLSRRFDLTRACQALARLAGSLISTSAFGKMEAQTL